MKKSIKNISIIFISVFLIASSILHNFNSHAETTLEDQYSSLNISRYHDSRFGETPIINSAVPTHFSEHNVYLGHDLYNNEDAIKNIGTTNVKEVVLSLYQNEQKNRKVNFHSLAIVSDAESSSTPDMYFTYEIIIKNGLNHSERKIEGPIIKAYGKEYTFAVQLPSLEKNEFIERFNLIPLGEDGTKPNELIPKRSISIRWTAMNWDNGEWPNGEKIDQNSIETTSLKGSISYRNELRPGNPFTTIYLLPKEVRYVPSFSVDADAIAVNKSSEEVNPETILDYELHGFNRDSAVNENWSNPVMVMRLPKEFELLNLNTITDYYESDNQLQVGKVSVTKTGEDNQYNYYKFQVNGNAKKNGTQTSIRVPFQIKVNKDTTPGIYKIPNLVLSGNNFLQVNNEMNTISDPTLYGFNNDQDKYSVSDSANASITVSKSMIQLDVDSSFEYRSSKEGSWNTEDFIGFENNSKPQFKLKLNNLGDDELSKVRVYKILPSIDDSKGSTGSIELMNIETAGKVYYTTKKVSELPTYNTTESNLQSWDTTTLDKYGFTVNKPSNPSDITAIFIDYDNTTIESGKSAEIVIDFLFQNIEGQVLGNQFVYSVIGQVSGDTANKTSKLLTLSNEKGQVTYKEKKPITQGTISSMPSPIVDSVLLDVTKKGSLNITKTIPLLPGYTFVNWLDSKNNLTYYSNDRINFDKNVSSDLSIVLETVWQPNTYSIKFDANGGEGRMSDLSSTYDVESSITKSSFSRPGFVFEGWSTSANANVEYYDQQIVKNLRSEKDAQITLYAIWKPNLNIEFNVEHDLLYAKQGDTINKEWILKNAKPTTNIEKIEYELVGTINSNKAGEYSVNIQFDYENQTYKKEVTIDIKPKLTLGHNDITLKLSELNKELVISNVKPIAWNTSSPLNATKETNFTLSDLPRNSGTHNISIKTESNEIEYISLTIINDVEVKVSNKINANNIRIHKKDLINANILELSQAKGLQQFYNSEGVIIKELISEVQLASIVPNKVGKYQIKLVFKDVIKFIELVIFEDSNFIIEANNIGITRNELNLMSDEELSTYIINESNAKLIDASTNQNYGNKTIRIGIDELSKILKTNQRSISFEKNSLIKMVGNPVKQKTSYKGTMVNTNEVLSISMKNNPTIVSKGGLPLGICIMVVTGGLFWGIRLNKKRD